VPAQAVAQLKNLHVIVPVRGARAGKSRLGEALDPEERQALIVGLLLNTLNVLADWSTATGTHVITSDIRLRRVVRSTGSGARPIAESGPGGLNSALLEGRERALRADATAVLYLPADLPHVSTDALDRMLEAADAGIAAGHGRPVVVVAPADARTGTNGLLVSPPDTIDPHFGEASLEAHIRATAVADASLLLVNDPALGFDLDTPDDLERLEVPRLVELQALGQEALDQLDGRTPAAEVA
jgi:2-phospho-L-lactate guanylyltransferase